MAIIVLENTVGTSKLNTLIAKYNKSMQDIEYLLSEAPKKYEMYDIIISILKEIKRGKSKEQAIKDITFMICPDIDVADVDCTNTKCNDCWLKYVDNLLSDDKEKPAD